MAENKEQRHVSDNAQLMAEWNWEKNNNLGYIPNGITFGSIKKVWWICDKGHEWQATPNNRSKGQRCPYCTGRKVIVGFNDLATTSPELVLEWHPTKNVQITPWDITGHSHTKIWWKCNECGNEWQTAAYNRVSGKGCPACSKRKQGISKVENIIKNQGSFAEHYPHLLDEWDCDKNCISPYTITKNSTKKIWWKCKTCNYSWQATVHHRTLRNQGCPACNNSVVTKKNNLTKTHPEILKKWNYSKNIDISPECVTAGSNKKVWWICDERHEWQATVHTITSGGICPICCNQKVLQGFNDLKTVNPRLAKEWHPTKNKYSATEVTVGSSKDKIWWVCPRGHEYQSTVARRSNGGGCPICDKESKTSFPEQAIYFYLNKITKAYNRYLFDGKTEIDIYLPDFKIGIEYDGYYYHSGKNAEEKETQKNETLKLAGVYLIRVKETKEIFAVDTHNIIFVKNTGFAAIQDMIVRLIKELKNIADIHNTIDVNLERDCTDIYSQYIENEKANSLANLNPPLACEWHPTKNGFVKPDMVSVSSGKKVWWLGSCGHEWQMSIENRNKGASCPYCSGKKVLKGFNDLITTHPHIAKEWDYQKNEIKPDEISHGSDKKVWWICEKGHSFHSTVSNRILGKQCPTCSLKIRSIVRDRNRIAKNGSLQDTHPFLAKEWHKKLNTDLTPNKVTFGSDKKVWWTCQMGHDYQATVSNRVAGKGCPICAGKKIITGINDLITLNPKLASEWDYENNITDPKKTSPNSHKKAFWVCSTCGYKWEAQIKSRNSGVGCPKCAKEKRKKSKTK